MNSILVIGLLFVKLVICSQRDSDFYRAGFVESFNEFKNYKSIIQEAARSHVDLMMMPTQETLPDFNTFEEIKRSISQSTKQSGLYTAVHLQYKVDCDNKEQIIRNGLVFDRRGNIVVQHVKPLRKDIGCSKTTPRTSFKTDFGVEFGFLMEDDVIRLLPEDVTLKNYLVVENINNSLSVMRGSEFYPAFSFIMQINILMPSGLFGDKTVSRADNGKIHVAVLQKNVDSEQHQFPVTATKAPAPEDLSQFVIRPLDVETSLKGHSETVCHGSLCCQFYVKTRYYDPSQKDISYGLAVYDGTQQYAGGQHIGVQRCSVVACAGLYKKSCNIGSNNNTNTHFERIIVSGNFTKAEKSQLPLVITTSDHQKVEFNTETEDKHNKVTIEIANGENIFNFGIFGRDRSRDFVENNSILGDYSGNFYDYFFDDDVQEFFDYLWIRIRVLMFLVSIYVLEMM